MADEMAGKCGDAGWGLRCMLPEGHDDEWHRSGDVEWVEYEIETDGDQEG